MLRLAKLSDYAIVVLAHVSRRPDRCVHPARDVAEKTGLPLPTVQKVMKVMSRAGLVTSVRGACGGYMLSREPASISLMEVIEAIEGPVGLTACATPGESCADEAHCQLSVHWPVINRAVREALERVTILDVSREQPLSSATRRGEHDSSTPGHPGLTGHHGHAPSMTVMADPQMESNLSAESPHE